MKKLLLALSASFILCLYAGAQNVSVSEWNGCTRYDYTIDGRAALMVIPQNPAPGNPWIWRPAFFGAFPSVDEALLKEGWHIGYYDVTHFYGTPESVSWAKDFYDDALQRFNLNPKATVEGFSRGGYFCFAWAAAYPETVASLYVDAPVCDLTSWPGREREDLWADMLKLWGVEDKDMTSGFKGNALQQIPAIAKAGIPIMAVCGGSDTVVPFKDNFEPVRDAYQALGGTVELILKPDCEHHPHSLENPEPVVDFLKRYAPGYSDYQDIHVRGDMDNAMYAMTVRKKACVAFLGGSITEMRGWRDMIKEDLTQRFPETEFNFIDAGIASLGSTPHAFRFADDVLAHGTPDLLFIEAAVNDDTNEFSPQAQVRAMEGIVRHARKANPKMDIVIMDFVHDPFMPLLDKGQMPDVVFNHERVANHYRISTINLISEIHSRMTAGEFEWEKFGGTHPAWFGHKFYAAAINSLLDSCTRPSGKYAPADHPMPDPLDKACYENGRLVPVSETYARKGFSIIDNWTPADKKVGTRPGFVGVPMLATTEGGSFRFDFTGSAVGIFCAAGPDAAVIRYRIDKGTWQTLDTFTHWSEGLYLPWVYTLADGLENKKHTLDLQVVKGARQGCIIRNMVVG